MRLFRFSRNNGYSLDTAIESKFIWEPAERSIFNIGLMATTYGKEISRIRPKRRNWCGFSACLFVVLLSVFTWVVHRRLTQYEAVPAAGGHHMTATKVCLTERPLISIPSSDAIDSVAMFLAFISWMLAWIFTGNIKRSYAFETRTSRIPFVRIEPSLSHFFSLPPPVNSCSL